MEIITLYHMIWQKLLDENVKEFIRIHEKEDVKALGLKKAPSSEWDYPLVLDQIKARQKAVVKLASWLAYEDIIFPSSFVMEQASSEACAQYKAGLFEGESFVDLTGGLGADSWGFLKHFKSGIVIERDEVSAALLEHNLSILKPAQCEVRCMDAEVFMDEMERVDLIFIDPQRRDQKAKGKFRFEDCSPDILSMLPELMRRTGALMIKTSPMLDVWSGIEALRGANYGVSEVHIVEWRGDCKEVLYIIRNEVVAMDDVPIIAVSIDDDGHVLRQIRFSRAEEINAECSYSAPLSYFYEPSAAFLKAGAFKLLASSYGLKKIQEHTHLYTGDKYVAEFPGRCFALRGVYAAKSKEMPVSKAHLSVRNFPQSVDILRKKLKIQDGGEDYLFACSLEDGRKVILHGNKFYGNK
tara:strand:- start:23 stop:1255 length:1233 start_codon:yes stop_codon:yes gene_type:complete